MTKPVPGTTPSRRASGYLDEPEEIYRRSAAVIRAEADFSAVLPALRPIVERLIHACGMVDIVTDLVAAGPVIETAKGALAHGAPVLCDGRMVAAGVSAERLPAANPIICLIGDDDTKALATRHNTTRAAAAVERWRPHLGGALVAIGNAPTALFRLIEVLQTAAPKPAAIFAFPVGFVGAAESKDALIASNLDVPYLTLRGRRGGSAMAAAAINALVGPLGTPRA
jgi:precorrin isomerase